MDLDHDNQAPNDGIWYHPDYSFTWTELHLPRTHTDPLRNEHDQLANQVLERLQVIKKRESAKSGESIASKDLYLLLKEHHEEDSILNKFWTEVNIVPSWVDWAQIERAQSFLYRYGAANILGFALQGFMGENSAVPGVAEVLARTGGFTTRVLLRRLMETFQWLLQVTHSLQFIQPGGEAWISTIKVRLLHASVRQRIMRLSEARPEYFDIKKFGVPANRLDSIHSIATFAVNPLFLQLPLFGIQPTRQEAEDYVALFRYLSYLRGTPHEYFATLEQAKATMESMITHEFTKPTAISKNIGYNLMQVIEDIPPLNISRNFIEAGARTLNGDRFCDALELGNPGWSSYAAFRAFCWIVRGLSWCQEAYPPLDDYVVRRTRSFLHHLVIHSKAGLNGGTKFDFEFVPNLNRVSVAKERSHRQIKPRLIKRRMELFLVTVFAMGTLIVAGVATMLPLLAYKYFGKVVDL